MPERELWPVGSGTEPVTRVSSCDSMTSTNSTHSGFSDSSYDFLSAEEKECLLFLEETIGSLDKEAESGLSTDESEPTTPQGPRTLPVVQGSPKERLTQEGSVQKRDIQSSVTHLQQVQDLGLKSGSHSLPRNIHINRNQSLREGYTYRPSQSEGHIPRGFVSAPLGNRGSSIAPPVPTRTSSELEEVLLPPPEAFRDTHQEQDTGGSLSLKEKTRPGQDNLRSPHIAPDTLRKEEAFLKTMSQETSEKGSEGVPRQPGLPSTLSSDNLPLDDKGAKCAPPTAPKSRKLPPNIILKTSRSSFHSEPQNRFSHRSQPAPKDSTSEHAGSGSSGLQEQRRARREALEKLGLPQDHSDEPTFHLTKSNSILKSKPSPAQVPTAAPAPVQTPTPGQPFASGLSAPAPVQATAPVWASVPVPSPAPAPARVSTSGGVQAPVSAQVVASASASASAKATGPSSTPIPIPKPTKFSSSPPTQSRPDSRLALKEGSIPGLRQMNFKSNTLERSGVGLSSYLLAQKDNSPQTSASLGKVPFLERISPNVLRNSRPRPASLGGGKDFANIQVGKLADLEQERSSQRFSYSGQSREKLPRPPCVSVTITPKGIPDEHRREALKKLGLLKE